MVHEKATVKPSMITLVASDGHLSLGEFRLLDLIVFSHIAHE